MACIGVLFNCLYLCLAGEHSLIVVFLVLTTPGNVKIARFTQRPIMSHNMYPHLLRRYKTAGLLAPPLDELVGNLPNAFRKSAPEETPILPRESLSLDALNEALEGALRSRRTIWQIPRRDNSLPYGGVAGVRQLRLGRSPAQNHGMSSMMKPLIS